MLYLLYRFGSFVIFLLPRWMAHGLACWGADRYSKRVPQDREAVRGNLTAILGPERVTEEQVQEVFRNFAIYLVDFFRFSWLNARKISKLIQVEGLEHARAALDAGKGAIGITAHLGNFEMAGAVFALSGFPIHAAVFTHQSPRVDALFQRQRQRVGVMGLPVQPKHIRAFFEAAIRTLRENKILALVSDRDFFESGLKLPCFGKMLQVPTGPAAFSLRTGAPILPAFLVRENNGTYRFICEPPLESPQGLSREETVRHLTESALNAMTRYIRKYPTQWYMFHEFWKPGQNVIL